jgi:hypothetical protein
MSDSPNIDAEKLAALIDGRLSDVEAAALRRQIATADNELLAVLADAAALSSDADVAESPGSPVKASPGAAEARSRWRSRMVSGFVLAAAAIIAAVVLRARSSGDEYFAASYADAVPSTAQLPGIPEWSETRGTADGLSVDARAVRIGVLFTDLELGAIRGDTAKAHAIALSALLSVTPDGRVLASTLSNFIDSATATMSRRQLRDIGIEVFRGKEREFKNAGAYLEAARLAARAGDSTFFVRVSRSALEKLRGDRRLTGASNAALARFDSTAAVRPIDLAAVLVDVRDLLGLLAR